MDRWWLLTWTTYGTWLPGDERGFVGRVWEAAMPGKNRGEFDLPGTPYLADLPGLKKSSRSRMRHKPTRLSAYQARILHEQFLQTTDYIHGRLLAGAIMANHVHLVIGVPGDPDPTKLLHKFKSYGTRALNRSGAKSSGGGPWWTESGSRRRLRDEVAIKRAAAYVRNQEYPLEVWGDEIDG